MVEAAEHNACLTPGEERRKQGTCVENNLLCYSRKVLAKPMSVFQPSQQSESHLGMDLPWYASGHGHGLGAGGGKYSFSAGVTKLCIPQSEIGEANFHGYQNKMC